MQERLVLLVNHLSTGSITYLLRYFVGLFAMSAAAIRFSSEHLHKSNTKLQAEVLTSPIKYGVVVDSDTAVSWRKIRYLVSETT